MKYLSARAAALFAAAAVILSAGQTHIWTQSDYTDFEKGVVKNLSMRSDGLLSLAPHSRELADISSAYLWALAQDSKGNLYTAGGPGAKLYRFSPDGKSQQSEKPKPIADLDALGIQALAIDSRDRVYAATSPDGKVYRIAGNSKPEIFYDPKAKYIWAMAFDSKGDLFVATGDQGEIHEVTPDGKGKVFFKSDETHVRSLAIDPSGNVIAGTDPGGLVLRVTPQGQGFVLYQMSKPEVTAVSVARDGSIYAAAVGTKGATAPPSVIPTAPTAAATVNAPGAMVVQQRAAAPPPPSAGPSSSVTGGSELYRIEANGNPRKMWSRPQDVVYAVAFDAQDRPILGCGNHGNVYRIDSPTSYTALLTVPSGQVTAFQKGRDGRLFASTGNVGKVYEIGPGLEQQGSIESDVFDASMFSLWGRVSYEGHLHGGKIAIQTRSGNLDQPQKNWSQWSNPIDSPKGAPITSPSSRFVQWKATFTPDNSGQSPELESVDVAYLPKNVEPRIDLIDITPANYKFPASLVPLTPISGSPQTINLPPIGKAGSPTPGGADAAGPNTPAMQFAKGFIGARWQASDPNGDPLIFTAEIRGEKETEWKPLKEKFAERYISWDSSAFPDGDYRLRITASDAPGNPPAEALITRMESDPFTIDNTPPRITGLTATRNGGKFEVRWHASDALSNVTKAEYSLDGAEWVVAAPVTKLSDSPELDYALTIDAAPGEHTIAVRATDDYENLSVEKIVVR